MEYVIELRFEDPGYNALIHFMSTFEVNTIQDAKLFYNELIAGFVRNGVFVISSNYYRIDNDDNLKQRTYEYVEFYKNRATAYIEIEQFIIKTPDQTKSVADNLINNYLKGDKSGAVIGNKYKIPVRVTSKESQNPITAEFFYFSIEHLIPKNNILT